MANIMKKNNDGVYEVIDPEKMQWNKFMHNPEYDDPMDGNIYITTTDVEPKEDFDKYYRYNIMYFKNVAIVFWYDFMKGMNFVIDSLEKHNFAYHFGRAYWLFRARTLFAISFIMFVIVMLYKTFTMGGK